MNLVEILKQQLGGEVAKTLSGLSGASEGDLTKIVGAALPGLLSGLGSLASSKDGAGKIAESIGGLDPNLIGNLAGMLGSSTAAKGGSMLGNLFGAGLVDNLSASISKFTGVNQSIVKTVLGFLTPLIMGAIAKSMGGAKADAAGVARLFSEQKSNISAAIPAGFSLNAIPGFSALANAASSAARPSVPPPTAPSGGLGKLLMPAIILVALAGLYFYWNNAKQAAKDSAEKASALIEESSDATIEMMDKAKESTAEAVKNTSALAADAAKSAKDALGGLADLNLDSLKTDFTSLFEGLTGKLGNIVDAAGAEAVLPDLQSYATKLDGLGKTVTALPAEGKSMIAELIKSQMDKINPVLEKMTGIPGIGETVLQAIELIKEKLKALVS